uniref:RING-type domain-containing protein n=1 Tax=Varanus komodoensis TaxID=61221 RepID=A0A8D2IR45_VARKO
MLQGEAVMATGAPVKELCEEATCPICLEYFKDLVMMDDCGHSFCKACLTRYWGESADASCPLCTEAVQQLEEGEKEGGIRERHQESLKLLCKEEDALIGLLRDRSRESWEHSEFPADEASQEYKVTDSSNAGTSNGRKGRGVSWRHKETLDLLDIWGEQKIQDQLRSSHRNIDFFEYIAQEMAARGHRRTAVECRSKTKVMRLEYKRVIGHNSRPGSNKVTCPFYKQLHRILRGDASVKPKRVSRSLNFKRGARQGAAPEPPSTEEHLSHADLPMINIGEYLKEESPDNTGDGMVSSNGAEEEMAETEGINIIQVEEEGSNEGSGKSWLTGPLTKMGVVVLVCRLGSGAITTTILLTHYWDSLRCSVTWCGSFFPVLHFFTEKILLQKFISNYGWTSIANAGLGKLGSFRFGIKVVLVIIPSKYVREDIYYNFYYTAFIPCLFLLVRSPQWLI